jgi:hypothetical protein
MEQKIYSALAKAKKDVDAIGKNRKNAAQGYNFRGIDDAMDALAPLLADHGLTIVCDAINHLSSEAIISKGGGNGWRVVNNYSFRIYAEDGSFIQGQADGEAIDYGDKCTTKAQSVALREFLFKTFMVPFHTVDDIEEASHDISKVEKPATVAAKPVTKPAQATTTAQPWFNHYFKDTKNETPEWKKLIEDITAQKFPSVEDYIMDIKKTKKIFGPVEQEIRDLHSDLSF